MIVYPAPPEAAQQYGTGPTSEPTRGGPDSERLAKTLIDNAQAHGSKMQGDGRLAALGAWVAGLVDDKGAPPPQAIFDFGARHLGIAEDAPVIMTLAGGTVQEREQYMVQAMASMPANIVYNRFGVASIMRAGLPVSVVVICSSLIELEPIPRSVPAGRTLSIRGRVDGVFKKHEVVVTSPDGKVTEAAQGQGGAFQTNLTLAAPGTWRIEILGAGPWGLTVLANFPVYAGTQPPATIAVQRGSQSNEAAAEATAEAATSRLMELLNGARKDAGLPALSPHPGLARVAEAHSRDMAEHGFFGHVSPTTGDPASRVRSAGMRFSIVAENVGVGRSASDVHRALLDSPGHRGNMLNAKLTHVGVGVILKPRDDRFDFYATQLFARLAQPIDVGKAPADLLAMINATRRQQSRVELVREPSMDAAAARGAALYFQNPKVTKEQVLDVVSAELEKLSKTGAGPWQRIGGAESYFVSVATLAEANANQTAFDPKARYIGLGIAQGSKPEGPDNMIAVVMIVGWPR